MAIFFSCISCEYFLNIILLMKLLSFTNTSSTRLHTTLCKTLCDTVNRTRLEEELESRHKIHLDRLNHGHCVIEKKHIQLKETQRQNQRQQQRLKTRPKTRQNLEKGREVESINISGCHLHLQHHLHRVSSIVRHQMSKGHDASTEDENIRHENSNTTTPRVYNESLRRPVKKPSTAPILFATHHWFEQHEHFLKNFLEGDDRSANTGLPLEEQNPVLHHCLRKLPAVLYLASTQNSCTMEWILVFALFTLYLYFKYAK